MTVAAALNGRRLVVRADASKDIGTGHLMRMLALAQAWIDSGGRVRWLLAEAPESLVARIESESIAIDRVGSRTHIRDALANDLSAAAALDGDRFATDYLDALGSAGARTLLVDDMAGRSAYPVGFVLNQNADADRSEYPADATCRFLLGSRYALLRREFRDLEVDRDTPPKARNILVTFGGADPTGMTGRTIEALRQLPAAQRAGIDVRVVIGAANAAAERIQAQVAAASIGFRCRVERTVADMAAVIAWADLAVTSGGSTVWELARMGCPALVVETVPSEERLMAGLAKLGLFDLLGPASQLVDARMAQAIAARVEDQGWRAEMSAGGRRLVDGKGALRVVRALAGENDHEMRAS